MSERFWSDDFDMDLPKVFPIVETITRRTANLKLWTVGHASFERLNHPVVWNSHGAFFWINQPFLSRDKHGWFNIGGCIDNAPVIECTWLELLRDWWPHGYEFLILASTNEYPLARFPSPGRRRFDRIMAQKRNWFPYEVSRDRADCLKTIWRMNAKFENLAMRYGLLAAARSSQ